MSDFFVLLFPAPSFGEEKGRIKDGWKANVSHNCHPASMTPLIENRCRRMRRNKIRSDLRTRACRYIDGNKIIPYYVISTLVRFPAFLSFPFLPLIFSHDVSGGSRVKSSEETLIGSDFSLSLVPSFSSSLSSRSSHVRLENSPVGLECSRKYFRVLRPIRRRERIPRRIFAPFSKTLVHLCRLAGSFPFRTLMSGESLWPWNFPSLRSLSSHSDFTLSVPNTVSRLSVWDASILRVHAINFNFNAPYALVALRLFPSCCSRCFFPKVYRTFLNAGNFLANGSICHPTLFLRRETQSVGNSLRLENYTPAWRTSDYPWPVVEELKLNDQVNVRFLRDFEMHPRPPGASCSFFSRSRYFFSPFLLFPGFFSLSFFPSFSFRLISRPFSLLHPGSIFAQQTRCTW